ncbi:RpiB/LacA/LacB family sugar-phosphate isomerase [Streptococcus pluranimalium]|uniref:RpiB/LacA/LacB family sugar-phosphate isomerase n=1 Tax=Streptococcus pluranimalium TaxID=82348 RepID=UPI00292F9932|nr:RpiB/LacA/LacB family sugar-phosphate isomerase [Streptococcus pluranimalium]MDY3041055.1 RpiB/LacA/LacB family sugar-phosphate isomerase [Streptococcus pluranimalium]
MKIGVIQASTRTEVNELLYKSVQKACDPEDEVINFGIFPDDSEKFSYVEIAVMISLLIETESIDFVVTGCSSGQGMMMACNSLPGIRCGFIQTPQDAFLFGRINNGNVVSLPLGLNFGWAAELNLQYTLDKLFDGDFGVGYPDNDAERKREESQLLIGLHQLTNRSFLEILDSLDEKLLKKILSRKDLYQFLVENGKNTPLLEQLELKKD